MSGRWQQGHTGPSPEPPPHPQNPEFDDRWGGALPAGLEQSPPNTALQDGPAPPQESLFGLAADLAGHGLPTSAAANDPPPPGTLRPARLGAARVKLPAPLRAQSRAPGPPNAAARARGGARAGATGQEPQDPFDLANTARRPPAPGADGDDEEPYGLALDLLKDPQQSVAAFPPPSVVADRAAERAARRGLAGARGAAPQGRAARLGAPPRAASAPPHPPPLDPFTVMELAASHEGLPEPDYGLVAELRNRAPPDPLASDFGLAAEVARRRSRSRSPSPSPLMRGRVGVLPPLRARRRLDPVMPPQDLDADIAARQRATAAAMADPFSAAGRTGGLDGNDPFALAAAGDEQLKLPRELLRPYEASQQELPGDDVRLKTPGDDASETSAVSRDDELYGLAAELGVDPETARRLRDERRAQGLDAFGMPLPGGLPGQPGAEPPEPPGHKYVYDEDTGMLVTTAGGQGDSGRAARQYIEDEVTGVFYKLHDKRRRLLGWLRRKGAPVHDDDEDEEDDKGFRGRLRSTLAGLTNAFSILGMFAQGLLAGFALLNFFMTYMLYGSSGSELRDFLRYYGPLAQNNNRLYYTLLALSVISSTSRLARDKLRGFQPRRLWLAPVDYGQMLLYVAAYVASVLCTPLDDELTYEYNRNPRFYELTFAKGFKRRLSLWHLLNIARTVLTALAWLLTCYQTSPHVFEATLRAELRAMRRQQGLLQSGGGDVAAGSQGPVTLTTSVSEGGHLRQKAA